MSVNNFAFLEWSLELPIFELTPSASQVVFEGDKLPFECRASEIGHDMNISWVRSGIGDVGGGYAGATVLSNRMLGVFVHVQSLPDRTRVSSLVLEHLTTSHSGVWKCVVETAQGSISRSVVIIVLSSDTPYCPAVGTDTNKGRYNWPKSMAGFAQRLPCTSGAAADYTGDGVASASYRCDAVGRWRDLNTSDCQYTSTNTRVLEEYAKVSPSV